MRLRLFVTLALIACSAATLVGQMVIPVPTEDDERLRLLYFTADWCGPCQLMQRQTWPVPAVQAELKQFNVQQINIDTQRKLAEQWGVRSIPCFIIADAQSDQPLARVTGFMDGDRMQQWLRDGRTNAVEHQRQQARRELIYSENTQRLQQLGPTTDPAEIDAALDALFTLLALREDTPPEHETALKETLHRFAADHPDQLVTGLLHEDLQVRVHVSRALSTESLTLDPWANAEQRAALIHDYRSAVATRGQ